MVGVNGKKFPDIRAHLEKNIASVYKNFDVSWVISPSLLYFIRLYLYPFFSFEEFPKNGLVDPEACTCPALPFL
jgi:D-galacturonate reductase